jgi:hypothetical protein
MLEMHKMLPSTFNTDQSKPEAPGPIQGGWKDWMAHARWPASYTYISCVKLTFFWSFPLKKNFVIVVGMVARFFLVQTYQNGKYITNDHKLHIPNGHKLYQMAIKYSKWSLPFKGPPKFTQICHFWFKKNIWQPWSSGWAAGPADQPANSDPRQIGWHQARVTGWVSKKNRKNCT